MAAPSNAQAQDRFQVGVVVLVLISAIGWIGAYCVSISRTSLPGPLPAAVVAEGARSHATELHRLQAQSRELYGTPSPEPAGS